MPALSTISSLPAAALTSLTGAARVPVDDAAGATRYATLDQLGQLLTPGFNPTSYAAVGTTDYSAAFSAASAAALAAGGHVALLPGTYHLAGDTTVAVPVSVTPGAIVQPAAGVTFALAGSIQAARVPFLDVSLGGTVTCYGTDAVCAEWFGVVPESTTATTTNSAAITAAINSLAGSTFYTGGGVTFGHGSFYFAQAIHLSRSIRFVGVNGAPGAVTQMALGISEGTTLVFPVTSDGLIVDYPGTGATGARGDGSTIEGLRITTLYNVGTPTGGTGITLKARARIIRCAIDSFGQDGIAVLGQNPASNANNWSVEDCSTSHNGRHGLYTHGADSNAGYARMVDASYNGGWGIYESSFLGNTYEACHTSFNTTGAYQSDSATGANVFVGCYSEGGQPASAIIAPSVVIGGTHGAGFTTGTTGLLLGVRQSGAAGLFLSPTVVENDGAANHTQLYLGYPGDTAESIMGFAGGLDINAGGYRLRYDQPVANYYAWMWANSAIAMAFGGYQALDTSGRSAAGLAWFPTLYLGNGFDQRRVSYSAASPSTGTGAVGDIVFKSSPTAGGKVGWVCTTAGSPGTWKPFGAIDP